MRGAWSCEAMVVVMMVMFEELALQHSGSTLYQIVIIEALAVIAVAHFNRSFSSGIVSASIVNNSSTRK
jgi:uncharacterized protein involved in response to NO